METVELTRLGARDLAELLREQVESWNNILHWDYSESARAILEHVEERSLPGFAAVQDGRVMGYAFLMFKGCKGMIGDLFVTARGLSAQARRAVEIDLVHRAVETLRRISEVREIEAQFITHADGTFLHSLRPREFERHRRLMLRREIGKCQRLPVRHMLPQGFALRPWTEEDHHPAAGLLTAAYRAHVDNTLGDRFRNTPRSLEFLNSVIYQDGCGRFDPESSCVAVHSASGERVGLLLASQLRHDVGHIIDVCTEPGLRNFGLGESMVRYCAGRLAARGVTELTTNVTEANLRAQSFYARLGLHEYHRFDVFTWERCPAYTSLYAQSGLWSSA